MSQLKPKRIVLHCGLHKTGSTYIQRNLQTNRELLLEQGVLYIGPNTFKKRCSALWRHLQWGRLNRKTPKRLASETKSTLMELAGMHPETIHTIFLSFEAIFGTLRSGLVEPISRKTPNHGEKTGLYRYAKARTKRLITGLEASLDHRSIAWTILITSRNHEAFVRSCHTQLLKEGHHKPHINNFDTFKKTADFSRTRSEHLEKSLLKLRRKRDINIITINYEQATDPNEPSALLWNLLSQALPEQSNTIKELLEADKSNSNLQRNTNPGLSKKGIDLAIKIHPMLNKTEWKKFRKFLEKYFSSNSRESNNFPWDKPGPLHHQHFEKFKCRIQAKLDSIIPTAGIDTSINERGLELAIKARALLNHREWKLLQKFLVKNFAKSS